MKVYLPEPIPKTCSTCPLGRKIYNEKNWVCFVTGMTKQKETIGRPKWCPIEE